MSLTLQLEDLEPDIFISNVNSPLFLHELIYHINNKENLNFIRELEPFCVKRKTKEIFFEWFSCILEGSDAFIISNTCYNEQKDIREGLNLFSEGLIELEQKHFLAPSKKKTEYFLVSQSKFKASVLKSNIGTITESVHIDAYSKIERQIFQDIYYEKQS